MDEAAARALHESAHACIARLVGIEVMAVSIAGDDPLCRTRWRRRGAPFALEAMIVVDFASSAGGDIEEATITDLANAKERCFQIVRMLHGTDTMSPAMILEASKIFVRLRASAADLVERNRDLIDAVAAVLLQRGSLDQITLDTVMMETAAVPAPIDFLEQSS